MSMQPTTTDLSILRITFANGQVWMRHYYLMINTNNQDSNSIFQSIQRRKNKCDFTEFIWKLLTAQSPLTMNYTNFMLKSTNLHWYVQTSILNACWHHGGFKLLLGVMGIASGLLLWDWFRFCTICSHQIQQIFWHKRATLCPQVTSCDVPENPIYIKHKP